MTGLIGMKSMKHTAWRATEGPCNVRHVWDDCLDAVAFAFDLGKEKGHANEESRAG